MARLPIYAWIRSNICGGGDVRGARIAELEASSSRTSGEIATPMSQWWPTVTRSQRATMVRP